MSVRNVKAMQKSKTGFSKSLQDKAAAYKATIDVDEREYRPPHQKKARYYFGPPEDETQRKAPSSRTSKSKEFGKSKKSYAAPPPTIEPTLKERIGEYLVGIQQYSEDYIKPFVEEYSLHIINSNFLLQNGLSRDSFLLGVLKYLDGKEPTSKRLGAFSFCVGNLNIMY